MESTMSSIQKQNESSEYAITNVGTKMKCIPHTVKSITILHIEDPIISESVTLNSNFGWLEDL